MRNDQTLYKALVLTLLFWCCIGAAVVAHDYKLQSTMQYAERPLPARTLRVSPDSRLFMAMPTPVGPR